MKIDRFLDGLREKMEDPDDVEYVIVVVPGDMDPLDRDSRFAIHLDAELRLAELGCCNGGGTLYGNVDFESDEESEDEIAFTMLDIAATDVDGARALLHRDLPELGCPEGTLVQYRDLEDRYDGRHWHMGEPRSIDEF